MKIVIIENHLIFRDILRKVCIEDCHHEVVGATDSASAAVELVRVHTPDIALLDPGLSDGGGFLVAEEARRLAPALRILVISDDLSDYTLQRIDRLHVHGYIDKNKSDVSVLTSGINAVASGQTFFSDAFRRARASWQKDPASPTKLLSDVEHRILCLIAQASSDAEIARQMAIAESTAKTHRSNVMRRFDLPGTPKLMAFALQKGYGPLR